MKRRAFTLIEALVIVAIVAIIAAVVFPIVARLTDNEPKHPSCQSNLKQIGLGFKQYIQDYNETYPLASSSGSAYGWADALQPYLKSTHIYHCSLEKTQPSQSPTQAGYTDEWFNSNLSGISESKMSIGAWTILNGEGNSGYGGTDARYAKSKLPTAWRTDKKSPSWRHLDGGNYSFADGHVKWFKPNGIQDTAPVAQGKPTFSIN